MRNSILTVLLLVLSSGFAHADDVLADRSNWRSRLTFHASFDGSPEADVAKGDGKIWTADDLSRKQSHQGLPDHVQLEAGGRWGECLRFLDTSERVLFYHGANNVPYDADGFDMTITFWMRLDPERDLKPGYVDPLQITDKKWNDASLFVDFDKDPTPRHFRLGLFSDYKFWNPQNIDWAEVPDQDRPMITVTKHPFTRDAWTHVAITLRRMNTSESAAEMYLDGESQGILARPQQLTWDPTQVAIMLGIQYIGRLDDFAVFDGSMSASEVQELRGLSGGIKMLDRTP